jgi:integrase
VRRLPINTPLRQLLADSLTRAPGDFLFPSPRPRRGPDGERLHGLPFSLDAITRGFHRAAVKAGVRNVTFHDVRHSHATKLRRRGVGLDVIAKLLGHSQLSTSARYAHVEPELLRAAVADLPAMQQPTDAEIEAARKPAIRRPRKDKLRPIASAAVSVVVGGQDR